MDSESATTRVSSGQAFVISLTYDVSVDVMFRAMTSFRSPAPGPGRVDENAKASASRLDRATLQRIDAVARPGSARGATLV